MPSLYESSSLVILEAISNKKIVIASNIGPNKELSQFFKFVVIEFRSPVREKYDSNTHNINNFNKNDWLHFDSKLLSMDD